MKELWQNVTLIQKSLYVPEILKFDEAIKPKSKKKNPTSTSHYCYGNCTVWKNLWINTFTSIVQGRGEKEEKGKKR